MFKILPYKMGSASVKKLKTALSAMILKLEGSRYRYKDTDIIINWGNSRRPDSLLGQPVFNEPEAVAVAGNKLSTFEALEEAGVPHVPFTTSRDEAQDWLRGGHKVFARDSLTGHSGEGITVITPSTTPVLSEEQQDVADLIEEARGAAVEYGLDTLASALMEVATEIEAEGMETSTVALPAPLYTRAVRNHGEYRVHVFDGDVILYQKKSRRVDELTGEVVTAEGEDADVRNLASNWIYRTGNLNRLERVEQLAISAVNALGLDFGAVDIIMDPSGDVYVLEVNTAPGLGNEDTLQAYTDAFLSLNA